MDLYLEQEQKKEELHKAIEELKTLGELKAKANRDFKVLKAKAKFRLKNEGNAIGILEDLVYLDDEVAQAQFDKELSESLYDACKENINAIKIDIATIREQLAREYGR